MDLPAISSDLKATMIQQQVGLAVQKLSMDSVKENMDAMRKVLESSVSPHLGGNFDMKG